MSLSRRLSALALAALLTPLLALAQDDGGSLASPAAPAAPDFSSAAPAAPDVSPAEPAAAAVKADEKAREKADKKSARLKRSVERLERLAERREMRGKRLREKGEALGGGNRLAKAAEMPPPQGSLEKRGIDLQSSAK